MEGTAKGIINRQVKIKIMPTKEYQIIVNGKVVNRKYTIREHEIMCGLYKDKGINYTTKVRILV